MPIECERLQGFPKDWTLPEILTNGDRADPDKIDTLRYHALGNAVTVPVAEWLAARIKQYLQAEGVKQQEARVSVALT
jgi:DNA (cytosine-5)-methyltransferase 1